MYDTTYYFCFLEGKSAAESWSSHNVEKALWAYHFAQKFNLKISLPSKEAESASGSDEELMPKAKRIKPDIT